MRNVCKKVEIKSDCEFALKRFSFIEEVRSEDRRKNGQKMKVSFLPLLPLIGQRNWLSAFSSGRGDELQLLRDSVFLFFFLFFTYTNTRSTWMEWRTENGRFILGRQKEHERERKTERKKRGRGREKSQKERPKIKKGKKVEAQNSVLESRSFHSVGAWRKNFSEKKYFDHRWQIVPSPFGDKCNVLPVLWQEKDLAETIETFSSFTTRKKNHISEQMESSGQYFCCQLKRVWNIFLMKQCFIHKR